jgi:putative ABC transport system ATP-binding protein
MIRCEGLVKIYRIGSREVVALQGLELQVAPGEILGLVGPSGAGKSTLLNVLGGLDRPSAGQVWVNGRNLAELPEAALDRYRREGVGFVWQQSGRNLIGYLTALENVMLPMQLARVPRRARRARAVELLTAVGLATRMDHVPPGSRAVSSSGSPSPWRWPTTPRCCWPTSPPASWTRPRPARSTPSSASWCGAWPSLLGPGPADWPSHWARLTIVIVSHDPTIAAHVDRVVSIQDGKTSTETVRVARKAAVPRAGSEDGPGRTTTGPRMTPTPSTWSWTRWGGCRSRRSCGRRTASPDACSGIFGHTLLADRSHCLHQILNRGVEPSKQVNVACGPGEGALPPRRTKLDRTTAPGGKESALACSVAGVPEKGGPARGPPRAHRITLPLPVARRPGSRSSHIKAVTGAPSRRDLDPAGRWGRGGDREELNDLRRSRR